MGTQMLGRLNLPQGVVEQVCPTPVKSQCILSRWEWSTSMQQKVPPGVALKGFLQLQRLVQCCANSSMWAYVQACKQPQERQLMGMLAVFLLQGRSCRQ